MRTAEQIVADYNKAVERFKATSPECGASKLPPIDIRAVNAAFRIMDLMQNYPIQNAAGEDFSHPSKWDERTVLMMTGAIMKAYEQV